MKVKLDEKAVKELFEKEEFSHAIVVDLYRMVFPDYDDIKTLDGWPTIHKESNAKLFRLFMNFDQEHNPEVLKGGLWLNTGFSTLEAEKLGLEPWEVDTSTCTVNYREDTR